MEPVVVYTNLIREVGIKCAMPTPCLELRNMNRTRTPRRGTDQRRLNVEEGQRGGTSALLAIYPFKAQIIAIKQSCYFQEGRAWFKMYKRTTCQSMMSLPHANGPNMQRLGEHK